jgi:hypothetical protein
LFSETIGVISPWLICKEGTNTPMRIDPFTYFMKSLVDTLGMPIYRLFGRRPFSVGYFSSRWSKIRKAIDQNAIEPGKELPKGFGGGFDERVVEYPWIFGRLRHDNSARGSMLDAGSTLNFNWILNRSPLKGADITIMTLAPEKRCYWHEGYSYVFGDLRSTTLGNGVFDTIVSISTIEHIGLDNTLLYTANAQRAEQDEEGFVAAVQEFRRMIRPGGNCYLTFPYGRHRNHKWYQVFDHSMVDRIIEVFGPSDLEIEYFAYGRDGWRRAEADAVKDATTYDVHSGEGWSDDLAPSCRAIACMRLVG